MFAYLHVLAYLTFPLLYWNGQIVAEINFNFSFYNTSVVEGSRV